MKFSALIFFFGLASASLLEIYPDSDEEDFLLKAEEHKHRANENVQKLKDYGIHISDDMKNLLEELNSKEHKWAQDLLDILPGKKVQRTDELKTELGRKARELLEQVLWHINHTMEEGKHVSEDLVDQAKHLAREMKKWGVEVRDETKDMLNYWKVRASRWVDELLDIIRGDNSTAYYSEPEVKTELGKELKEKFKEIMGRIKQLVQDGKHASEELWDELKRVVRKMREHGMNVKDEMVDMLEYMKERYQRWMKDFIDILRGRNETL